MKEKIEAYRDLKRLLRKEINDRAKFAMPVLIDGKAGIIDGIENNSMRVKFSSDAGELYDLKSFIDYHIIEFLTLKQIRDSDYQNTWAQEKFNNIFFSAATRFQYETGMKFHIKIIMIDLEIFMNKNPRASIWEAYQHLYKMERYNERDKRRSQETRRRNRWIRLRRILQWFS